MAFALALSRLALALALLALLVNLIGLRSIQRPPFKRRKSMTLAMFALGIATFALFFGMVAACDRL